MSDMAEATTREPFKGLSPYGEEDATFFFGREEEQDIIIANLHAYPLTLLYGGTGVGKSSVLRAGVAHRLREQGHANLAAGRLPEQLVAVVRRWRDDPMVTMRQRVEQALRDLYPSALEPSDPEDLGDALGLWAERIEGPILIILDQVEEYFLYQRHSTTSFSDEFPRIANSPDILANFVVAIREDTVTWLDEFKPMLPSLYDNTLRIRQLDEPSARRAIEAPLEAYNRDDPPTGPVTIQPELVDAVLHQIASGQVTLDTAEQGLAGPMSVAGQRGHVIEPAYLQLVMRRLWDEELAAGSRELRLATLERLGGARSIVSTHLDASMRELSPAEQGIAAAAFQHLVTPSGTKFAHLVTDLAGLSGTEPEQLATVVRKLAGAGILRRVPPTRGQGDVAAYEIFHDVLARAVLGWRARYVDRTSRARARAELERQLREKQAEAEEERRRREREEHQRRLALSNELAAVSMGQLSVDPELSVLLAVEAIEASVTPLAQDALRQALLRCRIRSRLLGHGGDVSRAGFSPDGRRIVTASQDTTVRTWEAATGQELQVLRGHEDWVWRAVFSPDGERIVSASQDGTARLWDPASGEEIAVLEGHGGPVRTACFDGSGALIVTASDDGTARLWDGRSGEPLRVLDGRRKGVREAVFTPDGRRVVTGGIAGDVQVWDTATGDRLALLTGHTALIWGVAVSPDGRLAATASKDQTARLWDLTAADPSTALVATLQGHTHEVWSVNFSPDGEQVVTGSFDWTARVWDVHTGETVTALRPHTHSVYCASFSPDGRWVLTASLDGTAAVQEVDTGRIVTRLRGHTRGVNYAAFSPDGSHVVTTSQDATGGYWEVSPARSSLELRGHIRAVNNVAFSPDGRLAITASEDRTARIWDLATGQVTKELRGHTGRVYGAAFSHDGTLVITASEDRTAYIWDAREGHLLAELQGHAGAVNAAAFSLDDQLIAIGGDDGSARIYQRDVRPTVEDLLARARDRVTRQLTPEERIKYLREGTGASDADQAPVIISL
jgi:WD40 repeat protein